MPQVLLINPIDKGVTKMAKAKRSPKQLRAIRKLIAFNRARAKGASPARKRPARVAKRAAPKRKPAARSASRPARRATRRPGRTSVAAAHKAGRALRYRRKSNPMGLGGFVKGTLIPSAIGGAGALGLDVVMAVLPLPDAIKTGPMRPLVRVAGAVALGMIAGKVTNRRMGEQVAAGALTVVLYDLMKSTLARVAGGKIPGIGLYDIPGIGMYEVAPAPEAVGYYEAGQQVGDDGSMMLPDQSVSEFVSGAEDGVYR